MSGRKERARLREIISVFIKYGVKEGIKTIHNPVQIRLALEELGPTFVKIGQILSTRPDLLPEPFILEFQKLQDDVKPEKFEDIKQIIEKELNGTIEEIFASFDIEPIASASLAQVHTATLVGGEKVVVKIQRPRVRETLISDIAILKRLSRIAKLTPQANVLNPEEAVDELWFAIKKELDFLTEAKNMKKFYELNKEVKYITCPKVYDEYTTSTVLVMEYIDGIKVAGMDALVDQGYDLDDIAVKLTNSYFKQVFEDGFFHADPHPGNILIKERKIVFIDFGMMGSISKPMQDKFNSFLYGAATRNVDAMTNAIMHIGIRKGSVDIKKLYSDVEQVYNSYAHVSLYEIDLTQMMDEVFKAFTRNNIAMPRDITMLVKGIITIEGVVLKLSPELNIMDIAIPYAKSRMLKGHDYKQDIIEQLENLYALSKAGFKIPVKLLELINSAVAGKLKIQMEHSGLEKSVGELNKMANRVVFGLIVSALIIGSSVVLNANVGPKLYDISVFGFAGFFSAAVMGFWLLISIIRSGKI